MSTDTVDASGIDTVNSGIITVDYGQSLEAMIAAGMYDWVNPSVTANHFPLEEGTGIKKFRTKLFNCGRISPEGAQAAVKSDNFTPATHVHGLAYGATYPDEQRKHPIVCLGFLGLSPQMGGPRYVVCLGRVGDKRELRVRAYTDFTARWRFLGVQEVSGA